MCDNGTLYAECVAKYSLLQYCDFYGSVLAVWMTAMCLAEINKKLRSALHISGVLGILIGTQVTLTGLWNFAIPLIIAVIILATSWVSQFTPTLLSHLNSSFFFTRALGYHILRTS